MSQRLPVFAGAILLGVGLAFFGGMPFKLFVAAAWIGLILETSVAASRSLDLPPRKYLGIDLLFFGSCPLAFGFGSAIGRGPAVMAILIFVWGFILFLLFPTSRAGLHRWLFSSVVQPYLLIGVFSFFLLRDVGRPWPMLALGVVIAADTGAYLIGRKFGRRLLAPAISPAKTVEGAAAGVLLATVVVVLFMTREGIQPVVAVGAGACLSILAVLGDLFESFLKRGLDIKDFGSSLPGHGGLFDRLDSLLAVSMGLLLFLRLS